MNLNNTQRIQLIPNLFEMVCWSTGFGIILSTMLLIQYFRYVGEVQQKTMAKPKSDAGTSSNYFRKLLHWLESIRSFVLFKSATIRPEYE